MTQHPFRRIADDLREEILDGRITPGGKLPSENELAGRYGTTRTTVRKAIAVLRSEGHVASSQGSGSYVRSRPSILMVSTGNQWRVRRAEGVSNMNAELAEQGMDVEQRIIAVEGIAASDEVAAALALEIGGHVIVRRREVTINGEPMQLSSGYYPLAIFADTPVAEARRIKGGAIGYFEDVIGGRVGRFVERLSIRMPTPNETEALHMPSGVPVARTIRVAYDTSGTAIEMLDSIVPGDAFTFEYVTDVPPAESVGLSRPEA